MVTVNILLAIICFAGTCHKALVGQDTPVGAFQLQHMSTNQPGYGGDVLVFHQTKDYAWAIHRVWLLDPAQHRDTRIKSSNPEIRHITMGCINVTPKVYDDLISCCSASTLKVVK